MKSFPSSAVRRTAVLTALCLGAASCASTEQNSVIPCEMISGAVVHVRSTLCDGVQRICGGKTYAHQRINIFSTIDTPAAVVVTFSDGTSERTVIQGVIGQSWDKPAGTGVTVTAQC